MCRGVGWLWVSNGVKTEYHENGQKRYEFTLRFGKLHGLRTHWRPDGQKWTEKNWKDGKLHGLATLWYENGQKQAELTYKDGKRISEKFWDEDGNLTK